MVSVVTVSSCVRFQSSCRYYRVLKLNCQSWRSAQFCRLVKASPVFQVSRFFTAVWRDYFGRKTRGRFSLQDCLQLIQKFRRVSEHHLTALDFMPVSSAICDIFVVLSTSGASFIFDTGLVSHYAVRYFLYAKHFNIINCQLVMQKRHDQFERFRFYVLDLLKRQPWYRSRNPHSKIHFEFKVK